MTAFERRPRRRNRTAGAAASGDRWGMSGKAAPLPRTLSARRLVDALAAVASRYDPMGRGEKLRLLDALEGRRLRAPASLVRLHETLCFLQAYPDAPEVLDYYAKQSNSTPHPSPFISQEKGQVSGAAARAPPPR